MFIKTKNISDYCIYFSGYAQKNVETGVFSSYSGIISQENIENIYETRRVLDYDTGEVWYVYMPYFE